MRRYLVAGMLSLSGHCFLLDASPIQAQPTALFQPPQMPAVALRDQASVERALALTEQEEITRSVVPLKVSDVTLEGLVEQIRQAVPAAKSIEVRKARPVRLSFDLPKAQVGQVLQGAAGLAGCDLHLLPGRLLVAPLSELSKDEVKERFAWMPGEKLYTVAPVKQMFVSSLAASIRQQIEASDTNHKGVVGGMNTPTSGTVLLGSLGAEQQKMVARLGRWSSYGRPASAPPSILNLASDTKISLTGDARNFTLHIMPERTSLDRDEMGRSMRFTVVGDR